MTNDISLTFFGHSCLLVEISGTRLLLDPGELTLPLTDVGRIDAVLVTHAHPDHIDAGQLKRLTAGGRVALYGPIGVEEQVQDLDIAFTAVEAGAFDIAGVDIVATPSVHETLYPGIPLPTNLGYQIGGRVFAPGDALSAPPGQVEVLLAPLAGPWMKLSEGIDFVRAVEPSAVIPIHDAGLAPAHRSLHRSLFEKFGPEDVTFLPLDPGQTTVR